MIERILKASDFHVPFHDKRTIGIALKFIKHIKPEILIIDELMDFYSISKFSKDPHRKLHLQKDLDIAKKILVDIRNTVPDARIIMLESNHAKRLVKFLRSKAEELSDLRCMKLKELLELDSFNIEYKKTFTFRKVLFKHGNIVRQHSAYTAKAEMDKEGTSGASGHSHRLGMYFRTLRGGEYVWIEGGCLCSRNCGDEYVEGTANWQQGLSMFTFKKGKKRFHPELIPIIDREILWGGKSFK